jgi:hypothetical protein
MYLGYLKPLFIMKFTEVFLGETVNPQTGELVTKVWCKTDTGRQLKVANSIEEIQALGNSAAVLARLILIEGEYGTFARISNVIKSSKSLFAPVTEDDNDDEDETVAAGNEIAAPKKAKK